VPLGVPQSLAICRYFEALHPEPALFGRTPLEKAVVEEWTRRAELYVYLPIDLGAHFARNERTRAAADEFASWTAQSVRFLDRTVRSREFLVGDGITMADVLTFGALDYGVRFAGFEIPPEAESLRTWYAAIDLRPSASA
jgi:glutathione S-transferase